MHLSKSRPAALAASTVRTLAAVAVLSTALAGAGQPTPQFREAQPTPADVPGVRAAGRTAIADAASDYYHAIPYFPAASDPLGRQGFARIVNHAGLPGTVEIEAVDDAGNRSQPLTLAIAAGETKHFNSDDLERGNSAKGLARGTGPGQGDWRLELTADVDFEALSYIRTADGFITAMHDTAPFVSGYQFAVFSLPTFNPGSNRNQESLLRLVNWGRTDASAVVTGTDDAGMPGDQLSFDVPAGESRTYTAAELESGGAPGLRGSLGDGAGKWRLSVEATTELMEAMSLLSSPTGHLANLSTAPYNVRDGVHAVPLFPSASDPHGRQGFVRVTNASDRSGTVSIQAFDDTDRDYAPLTLAIGAGEVRHFNSDDLEVGNPAKGLAGSTGAGQGDWRLELTSETRIRVLAYVRTGDGFLTAMHDVAPTAGKRHRIAVFNPGSNTAQRSLLRLVNPAGEPAAVSVSGTDDDGVSHGPGVALTVPARGSRTLAAPELESGGPDFQGSLGDGRGKWALTVASDVPVSALSLLSSPTGHLTNLSTAPVRGAGQTVDAMFDADVAPIVQDKCVNCHVAGGESADTRLVFVAHTDSEHVEKNLAAFEDFLADVDGGADLVLDKIQGNDHGGGVQVAAGTADFAGFERFVTALRTEVRAGRAPDDDAPPRDGRDDGRFQVFTFTDGIDVRWIAGTASDRIASAMDHDGFVHIAWVDESGGHSDDPASLRYCRFDGDTLARCVVLHEPVNRIFSVDMSVAQDNTVHIAYDIRRTPFTLGDGSGNYAVMYSQVTPVGTSTRQISTNPTDPSVHDPESQYQASANSKPAIQVEQDPSPWILVYYRSRASYMIEAATKTGENFGRRRVFRVGGNRYLGEPELQLHYGDFEMPSLSPPIPAIQTPLSQPPHIFGGTWSQYVDDAYVGNTPLYIVGRIPAALADLPEDKDGVDDLVYHTRTRIDDPDGVDGFNYWSRTDSLQMYLVEGKNQMSWNWTEGDNDTPYDELVGRIARYRIDGPGNYAVLDDIRLQHNPNLYVACDAEFTSGRFACIYHTGFHDDHRYILVLDEDGDGTFEEIEIPGSNDIQHLRESTLSIRGDRFSFVARDRNTDHGLKVVVGRLSAN